MVQVTTSMIDQDSCQKIVHQLFSVPKLIDRPLDFAVQMTYDLTKDRYCKLQRMQILLASYYP